MKQRLLHISWFFGHLPPTTRRSARSQKSSYSTNGVKWDPINGQKIDGSGGVTTLLIGFITVKGAHLVVDDCFFLGEGNNGIVYYEKPNEPTSAIGIARNFSTATQFSFWYTKDCMENPWRTDLWNVAFLFQLALFVYKVTGWLVRPSLTHNLYTTSQSWIILLHISSNFVVFFWNSIATSPFLSCFSGCGDYCWSIICSFPSTWSFQ